MRTQIQFSRIIRCLVVFSAMIFAGRAQGATPAEVDAAITKAKAFLYTQQKPGGHWELDRARIGVNHDWQVLQGDTFGGFTSLATYALLAAGDSPQDPKLAAAIHFLEDADVIGIYSLGLRANVWALLPPSDKKAHIMADRDSRLIIAGMQTGKENPENKGFWEYGNGRGEGLLGSARFDHSVSQYGVLGLWACAQNNVDIPRGIWELIDSGWKSHQYPDGGWCYDGAPPTVGTETASMTAAGVATLFITDDMLGRGVDCKGNIVNDNIERGLAWISSHFAAVDNNYALYGVERIGTASGRKYFGVVDWYAMGAEILVRSQRPDGSWMSGFAGATPTTSTSFALLFLARGRQPIMVNKLQYDIPSKSDPAKVVEADWNQRPRDVANLVRWTGHQLERDLAWQIVNLEAPTDDLHDAPILYLSGDQDLKFTEVAEAKMRQFCLDGGLILANADCPTAKKSFPKSFEALGNRLFPRYAFRDIEPGHPIFTDQPYFASKWKTPQRLRGLSNGVREMLVLIPEADPSRTWQTHNDFKQDPAFQLGADVFLYAVDKQNLGTKGQTYIIRPDLDLVSDKSVKVARLMIGDNPDPEPSGWRRVAALLHNQFHLDVDTLDLKPDDKKIARCRLAHLTGTAHIKLTPAQRQQLVDYVGHGGTLIVDAAGGNAPFADDIATELKTAFGVAAEEGLKTPLTLDDPLFNLPNARITEVTYRDIYRRQTVGNLRTPRICGIRVGNRVGVFYSREDLTGGMVGEPVDGIAGYSPRTATQLMRNIVLYSGFALRPAVAAAEVK